LKADSHGWCFPNPWFLLGCEHAADSKGEPAAATALVNHQSAVDNSLVPFSVKHAFLVDAAIGVGAEVIALGLR
jgi:hypothetical protein